MASKVLVPAAPFTKLQVSVKKSPPEQSSSGFIIGGDSVSRVAHLEHSVRFLQDQHRLMLSGLHAEIEALRERNRDLQFQLIFNKESSPKTSPTTEENTENSEEAKLKREVERLEHELTTARAEAKAAKVRTLQFQRLCDAQAVQVRQLESLGPPDSGLSAGAELETRAELRARLADAEQLVRRLRGDAERQRREVLAAAADGVTNLLFDGAHATHAHLQCMKNSLHASLRASGMDYGYQASYHFPMHTELWRDPHAQEYVRGARARRPLTLPELHAQPAPSHHPRGTSYANMHARPRVCGEHRNNKKVHNQPTNGETANAKSPDDSPENLRLKFPNDIPTSGRTIVDSHRTYPELKVVVAKMIPQYMVAGCGPHARAPRRSRRAPPAHPDT